MTAITPELSAYYRSLDFKEEDARRVAAAKLAETQRRALWQVPRILEGGEESRRRIEGSHEARGVWRGGERLRQVARQRMLEQYQLMQMASDVAAQETGLQSDLAARLNALSRERAERGLAQGLY